MGCDAGLVGFFITGYPRAVKAFGRRQGEVRVGDDVQRNELGGVFLCPVLVFKLLLQGEMRCSVFGCLIGWGS